MLEQDIEETENKMSLHTTNTALQSNIVVHWLQGYTIRLSHN